MIFHAVEAASDKSYAMYINTDPEIVVNVEEELRSILCDEDDFTIASGTVEAECSESAAHLIMAGEWQYTQEL